MSYTFLAEQGEESSADCFSDIPLSALSRSSHIAERFCSSGSATVSFPGFQSGTTCEHSTENLGAVSRMSCAEDFHAKTLAQPEKAQDLTEIEADYGPSLPGSFAKYNHHSRLWKTAQCSLFGGLSELSETWPRWGMMQNGELFPRVPAVLHTHGKDCGYWDTPCKADAHPRAYKRKSAYHGKGQKHIQAVCYDRMIPGDLNGGRLNPDFVDWLMGWPVTWTGLQPLAMDKYQQWQQRHGTSCAKEPPPEHCGNGQHSIQQPQHKIRLDTME
jgi:hypothetical protein